MNWLFCLLGLHKWTIEFDEPPTGTPGKLVRGHEECRFCKKIK